MSDKKITQLSKRVKVTDQYGMSTLHIDDWAYNYTAQDRIRKNPVPWAKRMLRKRKQEWLDEQKRLQARLVRIEQELEAANELI